MKRLIISQIPDNFNPDNDILLGLFCLIGKEHIFSKWDSFQIVPDPIQTISELRYANEYSAKWADSILNSLLLLLHAEKLNIIATITHNLLKFLFSFI